MAEQLVLDLPHRAAMGADDFLVSDCNISAVEAIDQWPNWSSRVHFIEGPAGSGKTHLSHVWQLKAGAMRVEPDALDIAHLASEPEPPCLVLEDLDRATLDEQALFHLLNLSKEREFDLLITSRNAPSRLSVSLPDLVSRLRALPVSRIGAPDDALLGAVLLKHFSDRQLNVEPQVLTFLTKRTVRSMSAVRELAAAIDHAALSKGRRITRHLASEVLAQSQTGDGAALE